MTLAYRGPDGECVVMTACPFCDADLEGKKFPLHLPDCPEPPI